MHHIEMDSLREAARPEAARLIGADPDEIALVESTTHGLTLAAQAVPLRAGDRVLLCDLEFPEVAIPWCQRKVADGIEIDQILTRDGRILPEEVAGMLGPSKRVLAISSVQWSNGFRCDLASIGSLCRERGVWLVVDAVQQLGAVPLDVNKTPVDILACGGHKWLNSPFGTGILYIRRGMLDQLHPPIAGYMNLVPPAGGWQNYFQTPSITPVNDYQFTGEARRFEIGGTANYAGAIALAASVRLINEVGTGIIWEHIRKLTDHLIDGLRRLGTEVVTPLEPGSRSGIVTFSAGSPDRNTAIMERLLDRKILVSVRYTSHVGGVRVSCHLFNSQADIDRLISALAEILRSV